MRLFVNSIHHAVDVMRQAGIHAVTSRTDTEEEMSILIRIPKTANVSRETMTATGISKT